jgi:hypothetical protein
MKKETIAYIKVFIVLCLPLLYVLSLFLYIEKNIQFFFYPLLVLGTIILFIGFKFIYDIFFGKYI